MPGSITGTSGAPEVLKKASCDVHRVNWLMVLTQGKVAVHMLPEEWSVNGPCMADAVAMLPEVLHRMLDTLMRAWPNYQ